MSAETTKPSWSWTHNGANGEKLCKCEGKYYTEFAWTHFLEAYTGIVRPRDTPGLPVTIPPGFNRDGCWTFPGDPPSAHRSYKPDWTSSGVEIDFSDLDTDPGFPPRKP